MIILALCKVCVAYEVNFALNNLLPLLFDPDKFFQEALILKLSRLTFDTIYFTKYLSLEI